MTYVIAPTLTGYPHPGIVWLPDQWLAMMSGRAADLTVPAPVWLLQNPPPGGISPAREA